MWRDARDQPMLGAARKHATVTLNVLKYLPSSDFERGCCHTKWADARVHVQSGARADG